MITEEQRENYRRLLRASAEPQKPSERYCPECGARITETETLGEVGHRRDCGRRKTHYHGDALTNGFQTGRFGKEGSA